MNPDAGRRCAFCDRGGPLTREHVWPRWASGVIRAVVTPNRSDGKLWTTKRPDGSECRTVDLDRVAKRVCRECNAGWMSALETAVRPILEPMIAGTRHAILLGPDECLALACWAFKTVVLADLTFPDPRLPDRLRHDFFASRVPADDVVIRTGAYQDDLAVCYWGQPIQVVHWGGDNIPAVGWQSTFNLFHAVFQMLFHGYGKRVAPGGSYSDEATAILWPHTNRTIAWPPDNKALSAAQLQHLAYN